MKNAGVILWQGWLVPMQRQIGDSLSAWWVEAGDVPLGLQLTASCLPGRHRIAFFL
jgi:hypothetical protein